MARPSVVPIPGPWCQVVKRNKSSSIVFLLSVCVLQKARVANLALLNQCPHFRVHVFFGIVIRAGDKPVQQKLAPSTTILCLDGQHSFETATNPEQRFCLSKFKVFTGTGATRSAHGKQTGVTFRHSGIQEALVCRLVSNQSGVECQKIGLLPVRCTVNLNCQAL